MQTEKANGERQSKPIRHDAAQLHSQSISGSVQRSTKERGNSTQTTDVAPRRVNSGHITLFQAGEGKMRAVLATRDHSSSADTGQGEGSCLCRKASWPSFSLVPCRRRKASDQRAARALLSGLGECETQTFLFHLTNSCSFQGRFSSAQAGERQTCRGMIQAGRQQIHQTELPALAHGGEGRRGPSCSRLARDVLGGGRDCKSNQGRKRAPHTNQRES